MYKLKYSYKEFFNITNVTMSNKEELLEMLDLLTSCPNVLTIDVTIKRLKEDE